jgi:serine/threonine-protein kinase
MTAVGADVGASRIACKPGVVLVDRFILRRQLASGGSGEVWVASNRSTGGAVAIKLVRSASSALNAARFRQEAGLSAALVHRNIVHVFDFFDTNKGILGLVMECLRGETAQERLLRAGPLAPPAAVALVTQALAGLAHAHLLGIVHRDLKPANLFLATDPDGSTTTKILDFGVAHTPTNTVHTLHGQLLGTPRYMSPEQIRADGGIDGRSDIFAMGTVLFELLTGRCPFAAPFPTASLAAVLEAKLERDERIPEPLWAVLARALSKTREGRPASAKEFADALRGAVESNDGVLARELHRSRPPPPLFVEEANAPIIPLGTEPPAALEVDPREALVRERASKIVLGAIGVSFAILAAAGVRIAVGSRATTTPPVVAAPAPAPTPAPAPLPVAPTPSPTPIQAAPPAGGSVAAEAVETSPEPKTQSVAPAPVSAPRSAPARRPANQGSAKGALVRDPGF